MGLTTSNSIISLSKATSSIELAANSHSVQSIVLYNSVIDIMSDSKQQGSDSGGNLPRRGSRGNGKSSDERENSTSRVLQHSAITCTACGLLINKGRDSKSTADSTSTCSMDGAIRTRMTPPVDHICLLLPQNAIPSTPAAHEVLRINSPPQSVPMQRGRAYYKPPCGQPPSTGGITVTAGPTADPKYDAGGPFRGSDYAQSHLIGQVAASQLFHPMSRHLDGAANGFLDHDDNRGQTISSTPYNLGFSSLPEFTSSLGDSTGGTTTYYPEYQDDPNRVRLPPILSSRRSSSSSSREPFPKSLIDTATTCSEQREASSRGLPPRNPFSPSRSGSPSVFPIALRPSDA